MRWMTLHVLVFGFTLLSSATSQAQQQQPGPPLPRLDSIFPLGGKIGTSVNEVSLLGTDLEETDTLIFSHKGIKAELIVAPPPKANPKKDPKKEPKKKPKGTGVVAPSKFNVSIAADVPTGIYDVRAVNKWGVSNPRSFVVGDLTEVNEKEPNNDVPEAQKVEINTTINGVIAAPTDVDYSVFKGKKDQRILLNCLSTSIDSRLLPMIEVFDLAGKRIGFNRSYYYNDALADVVLPADGDYYVRLSQFTYTVGGPQYFYRLSITTAPWIDAVFPPMVEPGKPAQVTLYGRNLPGGTPEAGMEVGGKPMEKLTVTITPPSEALASQRLTFPGRIDPKSAALDGFEYHIKGPGGNSNSVLIALATAKVHLEREGNDKPDTAEAISVPCEVAGRINKRLDRDWYSFEAKKGEIFSIELWSDRLGGQSDFFFSVRNSKAMNDMTEQDDNPEIMNNVQFFTRTNDPSIYKFTAPEDGKFLIQVASRESSFLFGPRVVYRLRITPEKPDFRLIVMPSANHIPDTTVLRADGHQYFDVFAFRMDGFTGPITLTAEGLPPGVTCPPQIIGTGMKQAALVVSAAATAANGQAMIAVKGTATIHGQPVMREARAATITWGTPQGQNVPTIARLDQGLFLCIREKAPYRVDLEPEKAFVKKDQKIEQPLLLKQGEKLTVPFKVVRIAPEAKQPITMQQIINPQGVQASPVTISNGQPLPAVAPDKKEGTFVVDVKANAVPGTYTIALKASMPIPFVKDPSNKKSQNVTYVQSTTPLTIKVLPPTLGKLTVTGPTGNLKPGSNSDVIIKVTRDYDYSGEFKVKVVLPKTAKGVTVDDVTIPAGKDEAKVTLKVAADATAGALSNVLVQATGTVEGKIAITTEAKFSTNIEKLAPPKKKK